VQKKELRFEREHVGEAVVVRLAGPITLEDKGACVMALKGHLRSVIEEEPPWVIVDLSEVTDISSAGISALVNGLKMAKEHAIRFSITGVNEMIRGILEVSRIDTVLEVLESLDDVDLTQA